MPAEYRKGSTKLTVYRDKRRGRIQWRYRRVVKRSDGSKERISGTPEINTKAEAEKAERAHIARALDPKAGLREMPAFDEWFRGRFWSDCVLGAENRKGKPNGDETRAWKMALYRTHIAPVLSTAPIDAIGKAEIRELRARLARVKSARRPDEPLDLKTQNEVVRIVLMALKHAEYEDMIDTVPRVRLPKEPRAEKHPLSFEEYAALLAAIDTGPVHWQIAARLGGECGLREGEIRGLLWKDVDLHGQTLHVRRQLGEKGYKATKSGERRYVPLTAPLAALLGQCVPKSGPVVCAAPGQPVTKKEIYDAMADAYRRAELVATRPNHRLRDTFATHAARCGVNPWQLQAWLGHSSLAMTERYVAFAKALRWPVPEAVLRAGEGVADPDERITAMLGARSDVESKPATRVLAQRSRDQRD